MRLVHTTHVPETTRTYPRSLRSAFPIDDRPSAAIGINGPPVIRARAPIWLRWLRILFT